MNRRSFLGSTGLVAAGLHAQSRPSAAATSKITSSVVLDILGGTIDEQIGIAARAGCESMQMLAQFATWSDAEVTRVRKLCESHRIGMHALLAQADWKKRPVSIVDPAHRETFLSDIRKAIVCAQALGITQVIVTSGLSAAGKTQEEQYASLTEGVKRAADLVGAAKLTLLVEPLNSLVDHAGCFLTSCVEGLKLVREINHPNVRLCFDLYHEQVQRGNIIRTFTEAAPMVALAHVADNPGRNDPGSGEVNFANVYRAIQKSGYTGRIAMEYRPLGDPATSLRTAISGMRSALAG
jgi:hydroxypyruvate isomerase